MRLNSIPVSTGQESRRLQSGGSFWLHPVPLGQIGSSFVGAVQKIEQGRSGRRIQTNIVVHEEKFFHLRMIKRFAGADCSLTVACGLGGGVCVERRSLDIAAARPETGADHLM